jgi:uncharacterized protein (DUF58 family)
MNFAKLNYVLIPKTRADRNRWLSRPIGRALVPFFRLWQILTLRGRILVLVILLVAGFGTEVGSSQVYLLFSILLGVMVALWAARSGFALPNVHALVRLPKRVAVGDSVRFQVRIDNRGERHLSSLRVRGPFLPWDGKWTHPAPVIATLPPHESASTDCHAKFIARGEHDLEPFTVQALVPFGITLGPPVSTEPFSFVVVPRIAPIAHLDTPVTRRHQPGGVALASKTGESMDLLGIRDYRPGDPLRDLHARSWARLGHPVVREYQEEYFTRIGVVVDVDRNHTTERQLEAALSLAAGVVEHLSRGEALIDLLVVGDEVHTLTLGRSLGFLDQALDLLACVTAGGTFDSSTTARRLSPHLARLSCLVFVSMAWEPERQAFVQRMQGAGVACRTIVIDPPIEKRGSKAPPRIANHQPFVSRVDTNAIEKGEALWL